MYLNTDSKFWSKVNITDINGCWLWNNDKLGLFRIGKKTVLPHRLLWESLYGKIPVGRKLNHICKNDACINPAHLKMSLDLNDRFMSKINIQSNEECWNWNAYTDRDGYGHITINKLDVLAHRFIFKLFYGEIPKNMQVLHTCDNPTCCNPYHLFLGTNHDNIQDRINKNRSAKGEQNGTAKLKESDIPIIKNLFSNGFSTTEIAEIYNVTHQNINHIVKNKTWRHV